MALPVRRGPRRVVSGERVGVVGDLAPADVFVAQVAANEDLILFLTRDAADAAESWQIEKPFVVGIRMFPDEKCRVADVVRVGKPDQRAVAGALLAAQTEHRHDALPDSALTVEQAHPHFRARVAAHVAVANLTGDPFGGHVRRSLGGSGPVPRSLGGGGLLSRGGGEWEDEGD